MRKFGLLTLAAFTVVIPLLATITANAAPTFGDPNFKQLWERTDKILTERTNVGRGYIWGPESIFIGRESYTESEGLQRLVQYFDKARMEVTYSTGNRADYNFVTNGLLVKELVTGRQQNGNDVNNYTQGNPSEVQIAGDPNTGGANAVAPTYRSFRNIATFNNDNPVDPRLGQQVNQKIDQAGSITSINPPDPNVKIGAYESTTRHNIADVFVAYGLSQGLIWNGSSYINGPLFFPSATYVFGLPITDPYWIRAVVAGNEKDVLVQLFERRVLTYTPSNDANSKVEMGNVGQHYYRWRYLENIGLSSGSGSPTPVPTTPAPPPPTPPNDFSQARAPYLKTGPIPQGVTVNANNVATYPTGATQINSSPVYDPSLKLAFIGTNGSGVVAVDVNNFGTPVQRWRFNPANQKFIGPLVLYNGVIYVGGNDGLVYALRESDGAVVWSSSVASGLTGGVYTQFALDTDSLYTAAGDGLLHALNLSNGIQRWQVTGPGGVTLTNGPVIGADGTIYVTASDNRVYAYKKDGSQVSSGIWNPVALDGTIFATPALASGRLFVGTANGTLYALNSNGTIQTNKTFTTGKAIFGTPAVVNINGTLRVYVGTRDGNVYGADADNLNNVRWTFPVGAEVNSSVAVVDNFVYVAADNKNLYRVEATNASNSLVLATADDIFDTNSPVVNSGYAIIAARNGGKLLIVR